jgi:hypothetical protein
MVLGLVISYGVFPARKVSAKDVNKMISLEATENGIKNKGRLWRLVICAMTVFR